MSRQLFPRFNSIEDDLSDRIAEDLSSVAPQGTRSIRKQRIFGSYDPVGKRVFDTIIASAMLLAVWPIIVLLAGLVALDGHSPIFSHKRVGRNGRIFKCHKIRTMVPTAECMLNEIIATDPCAAAEWHKSMKLSDDPRITRLGKFLRATSLDELPQLWNVMRGEMSLVGPRPVTSSELENYGDCKRAYLELRPGLSGPWQVSGRNELCFSERVNLDVNYRGTLSWLMDLKIIAKTVVVVFRRTGK